MSSNGQPRNEICIAEFEGLSIFTYIWKGQPVWVAKQIGAALEYGNNGSRFCKLITKEWESEFKSGDFEVLKGADLKAFKKTGTCDVPVLKGSALLILTETGLYRALIKSEKPMGIRLRDWIVEEVLPSIRKTGKYEVPQREADLDTNPLAQVFTNPRVGILFLERLALAQEKAEEETILRVAAEKETAVLKPKAEKYDEHLDIGKCQTATAIASEFGLSAQAFNTVLHRLGIQWKTGSGKGISKVWVLYGKYKALGYTKTRSEAEGRDRSIDLNMVWTPKGRIFLRSIREKIEQESQVYLREGKYPPLQQEITFDEPSTPEEDNIIPIIPIREEEGSGLLGNRRTPNYEGTSKKKKSTWIRRKK